MGPNDEKYARATVLALATISARSLGQEGTRVFDSYMLAGDQRLLNLDAVVAALAELPKPVTCSAIGGGSTLRIDCRPRTAQRFHGYEAANLLYASHFQRLGDRAPLLLLRGVGETVVMTPGENAMWLQDYDFSEGLAFESDEVDAEARMLNAQAVLRIVGPAIPDYFRRL